MLLTRPVLDGLTAGTVTLVFRRWPRARVRAGSRLRTPIGFVAVEAIDVIDPTEITERDARHAGYDDRAALLEELNRYGDGTVHRIRVRLAGPDPRVALRERAELGDAELGEIRDRLARFDRASRHGPWTMSTLRLIADRPETRAADLAASVDREKLPFKRDVRKLKEMGLTESLDIGYRLSPRGRAVLKRLTGRG
jgi:hypothetical protein